MWMIKQQLEKPDKKQQLPSWTTLSFFAKQLLLFYTLFQACLALKNIAACRAGSCQRLFISAKPPTSCDCTPWRILNVNSSEMGIFQSARQGDAYSKSDCSEVEQMLLNRHFKSSIPAQLSTPCLFQLSLHCSDPLKVETIWKTTFILSLTTESVFSSRTYSCIRSPYFMFFHLEESCL